jgi:1,4-alpha-glucan branching enzyme
MLNVPLIPMPGYLSLVLHAHLPFVRHPEHEVFLEEAWLFEAITETYLPLLRIMHGWVRDDMDARLTLTLSPTLCSMLLDPLLQSRYVRHLDGLIALAQKEIHRTHFERPFQHLAQSYHQRFIETRDFYFACGENLVAVFGKLQQQGKLEIITTAATHALLPMLAAHPSSLRAQIMIARDHYRSCFGCDPRGIWLPECAYAKGVDDILKEANIRWFITEAHGVLHAEPRPRYGMFAPLLTSCGVAAFARDLESSRQVWSRAEGYPGDPRYRDFYRDIGFDLEFDYLKPHLPLPDIRSFTGIKYHRITGNTSDKQVYDPASALQAAADHAQHFLDARTAQIQTLAGILGRPPLVLAPYDAELFGHWWHEGPEFLDYFVRKACFDQKTFSLITPTDYLHLHPVNQIAQPSPSSWGEHGHLSTWLNETNQWIYPHLNIAQERMSGLARCLVKPDGLSRRALNQAGRELLLAQASDWPFIMRSGTSPEYARQRITDHLVRFTRLHEQLMGNKVDESWLAQIESRDHIFPELNHEYWK